MFYTALITANSFLTLTFATLSRRVKFCYLSAGTDSSFSLTALQIENIVSPDCGTLMRLCHVLNILKVNRRLTAMITDSWKMLHGAL